MTKTHFAFIPTAFAQSNANPCSSLGAFSSVCNLTSDDFGFVLSTGISLVLSLAIIIAVLYLIYGGIQWILSRGDEEKVKNARNHIVASVVGLIVVFLAFFTINIVFGFFFPGKSLKDLNLPTLGPDIKPPVVSIVAPISDSSVSGISSIQADATDNKQVEKVEFYVDGALKNTDTKEPYVYSWDTKVYKHNSTHTISAKAYDSSDNVGASTSVNVVVIDVTKPTVAIANPTDGQSVSPNTIVTITAIVSDVSAITQVEFRVNGVSKCTDVIVPYTCAWQIPVTKGVIYRIEASATDAAGNLGSGTNSVTAM